MSNATDTIGCLSHRPNCRFFIMYEDFQDVALAASGKEHENKLAAFWRVLETKTNDRIGSIPEIAEDCKKKGIPIPEEHLWVEVTYSECVNRSRKIYKESAFQLAAAESERLGFSKSRVLKRPRNPDDPDSAREEYKEYLFHTAIMQSVINGGDLPTPIEINTPLLKSYNKRKEEKKAKRAIEKNSTPLLKSIAPPIEINNNKYIKVSSKDKEDTGEERESTPAHSDASASAHTPSESSEQKTEPTNTLQSLLENAQANKNQSPPLPEKPVANKGNRTPRGNSTKSKLDEATQARVNAVFDTMDAFMREVMDDQEAKFMRPKSATECIVTLLECKPTPSRLTKVCWNMWDECNEDGTFWWRIPGHMTVRAICNQYATRVMAMEGKGKGKAQPSQPPAESRKALVPPRVPTREELKKEIV